MQASDSQRAGRTGLVRQPAPKRQHSQLAWVRRAARAQRATTFHHRLAQRRRQRRTCSSKAQAGVSPTWRTVLALMPLPPSDSSRAAVDPTACLVWQARQHRGCHQPELRPVLLLPSMPAAGRSAAPSRHRLPRRCAQAPARSWPARERSASGPRKRFLRKLTGIHNYGKAQALSQASARGQIGCNLGSISLSPRQLQQRLTLHIIQAQKVRVEYQPGLAVLERSPGQVVSCARTWLPGRKPERRQSLRGSSAGSAARQERPRPP